MRMNEKRINWMNCGGGHNIEMWQTRYFCECVNALDCATTMRCVANRHKSIFRLLNTTRSMRIRCRLISNLFLAIENYKCFRLRRFYVFLFTYLATFTAHHSLGKLNGHWVCVHKHVFCVRFLFYLSLPFSVGTFVPAERQIFIVRCPFLCRSGSSIHSHYYTIQNIHHECSVKGTVSRRYLIFEFDWMTGCHDVCVSLSEIVVSAWKFMNEIDRVYAKYCRLWFYFEFVVCFFFLNFICEVYFWFHQTILFIDISQSPCFRDGK